MKLRSLPRVHYTADVKLQPGSELTSSIVVDLQKYFDRSGNKEFLLSHDQGLPTHVNESAYVAEQDTFLKTCREVAISDVPKSENVISSHTIYKIKTLDDGSRLCKARITPYGNKARRRLI